VNGNQAGIVVKIFKNVFAEKIGEIFIITLDFEKNANFFAENRQKSPKILTPAPSFAGGTVASRRDGRADAGQRPVEGTCLNLNTHDSHRRQLCEPPLAASNELNVAHVDINS
jgi:hypothetical protein